MRFWSMFRRKQAEVLIPQPPPDVQRTSPDLTAEFDDLRHAYQRVSRTCEELRADLDWLSGELSSIRGKITGGSRRPKEGQPQPNGTPISVDDINAAIRNGTFRAR